MNRYIILAFVIFVAVQGAEEEQKVTYERYTKECIKESTIDEKVIEDIDKNGVFADDPKLEAYTYCFSKKAGFQDEKGEPQLDVIKKAFEPDFKDDTDKIIEKCIIKKETPEETALLAFKCLKTNSPKDATVL